MHDEINRLLRLKSENAKNALGTTDEEVADTYLSELFKGNGWTVAFHTGAWNHRSLLISDPKHPDAILWIVKFIFSDRPLSYERVKNELVDFENNLGPLYECTQFSIIAPNGFEPKTERLEDYNLLLYGWDYVEKLIEDYSKDNKRAPRIQLFAHNEKTYKKVKKMMAHTKGVAVVQATGTGKSYLIAKLLQDFAGKRRLVMAPSYYIIDQIKEHIRWETDLPGDANKIDFMTYARSMNLSPAEVSELKPEMIVLDEYHRCGAEEWGRGVQNILSAYHNKFKFGTSATPVRYLDNGRDMSVELFDGHVAENLSLAQAIARNILPMPKYVCALYTLAEEIKTLRAKIEGSRRNEKTKRKLLIDLDIVHIDWERSRGIPHVIKKHVRSKMRKFIVFCKDEEHLNEMEPIVKKWFREAMDDIAIKTYIVHSKEAERDENLEAFKGDTSKDQLHLLFSIDMLNEGLHVNEVNGVVLLRPTESPNIFYQQIGRCLKVGLNHQPVIFDFVNNFKSIHTRDFLYDLNIARKELLDTRKEEGLDDRCPRFDVNDEVREIKDVFGEIEFKLENWEEMYERLADFHHRFGHSNVPNEWEEDPTLYKWLIQQRKRHHNGKLEAEQLRKLNELKVEWKYNPIGSPVKAWERQFKNLEEFKDKFGHCTVPPKTIEYSQLYKWTIRQREYYRRGKLPEDRIKRLNGIGFDFSPLDLEADWQERFEELKAYKAKHGHFAVTFSENKRLAIWVQRQRSRKKKGLVTDERIKKLDSIGFIWVVGKSKLFEKRFVAMQIFKQEFHHLNFPIKHPLYSWSFHLRNHYRKGALTEEQIQRLKDLGFDLALKELNTTIRERRMEELERFYKKYHHIDVTGDHTDFPKLAEWLLSIRKQKRNGTLSKDIITRLDAMGMDWESRYLEKRWNKMYSELKAYYHRTGTSFIERNDKENIELKKWCHQQREYYHEGRLLKERKELLDKLDFKWDDYKDTTWELRLNELHEFQRRYGHCRVTAALAKEYPKLFIWVGNLRGKYRQGQLTNEQIKKLKGIGFVFNTETLHGKIERRMQELKIFYKKYGHIEITAKYKDYAHLLNWFKHLRNHKKKGLLPKELIARLDAMKMNWGGSTYADQVWHDWYQKLLDYLHKNGTLVMSENDKATRPLKNWCNNQRTKKKRNQLSEEQIKKLDKIGFDWNPMDTAWNERLNELKAFKKRFGHCKVNFSFKEEYPGLYIWYSSTSRAFKKGALSAERMKKLKDIGFE